MYHSGETSDLALVVERLIGEVKGRKLGLIGFSLGGNVITKYLGEQGESAAPQIQAAAVVSVPFDLLACSKAIDGPGLPAWIYRERFLRKLVPKALAKAQRFPGLIDTARVQKARKLGDFDDAVTAPLHGFRDALDYYAKSSSAGFLPLVRRPLLAISAEDDPFVPGATLPIVRFSENPYLVLRLSPQRGHVGFVNGPPWAQRRWAEEQAVAFVADHLHSAASSA
jgi:hypothetical protein